MAEENRKKSTRPTFKPSESEAPASTKREAKRAPAPMEPARRETLLEKLRGRHSMRYFFIFLGTAIAIQIAHDAEHVVQSIQVFAMGVPRASAGGLLGSVFDFPMVHFLYNMLFFLALLWAVAWAYGLGGFQTLDRVGMWALLIATGVQTYHAAEHVIQISQEAITGTQRPPGFIGLFQDNVLAHLFLNTIVWVLPAVSMWRFGGVKVYMGWVAQKLRWGTPASA